MDKIIGVAYGGYSSEREISIKSGKVVFNAIQRKGYSCFCIDISTTTWTVKDAEGATYPLNKNNFTFEKDKATHRFDCVVNMIHGAPGEDGQLAELLEKNKIAHTSCRSDLAALTFDKRKCLEKVNAMGIPSAQRYTLDKGDPIAIDAIIEKVGLPCFVKANRAGSSFGVFKVSKKENLKKAIHNAFDEDHQILIETALEGREITVGVLKWKDEITVLPITEIISENDFFDYQAKYEGKSKEITPAQLPPTWETKAIAVAKKLYQSLALEGITRSEFIFKDGIPHLLEINTIPGMTLQSIVPQQAAAAGISLGDLIHGVIETAVTKNV